MRLFPLALALMACNGPATTESGEEIGEEEEADVTATLQSGTYNVSDTRFRENDCGIADIFFFPDALTVTVTGDRVRYDEFALEGTLDNGEFRMQEETVLDYTADGLACVLDSRVDIENTVVANDEIVVEFDMDVDEAPLEPDADCEFVATTELGFSSWNAIAGCTVAGTWRLKL